MIISVRDYSKFYFFFFFSLMPKDKPSILTQNLYLCRYGHWGICYTYGTWFAVGGLAACGRNYRNCPALRKTCEFLLSKQLPNGGWGESYLSSQNKVWKFVSI